MYAGQNAHEPELEEAADLGQDGDGVDTNYEKDRSALTMTGSACGRRGRRLEAGHADVTLDSQAYR